MGDLDFKFVIHHGEMIKHKMGGREELVLAPRDRNFLKLFGLNAGVVRS